MGGGFFEEYGLIAGLNRAGSLGVLGNIGNQEDTVREELINTIED